MRYLALAAAAFAAVALAQPAERQDSSRTEALKMPLADESLLLDLTNTVRRTIAVGERGHVILSEDRQQWRQAQLVPTQSTLTAVTSLGDDVWAVGHDAVIIHSADGGETWELQHANPSNSLEEDPNPLFDILFRDPSSGIAIGAYGRLFYTEDGGASWEERLIGDLVGGAADEEGLDEAEETDTEGDEEPVLETYDYSDFEDVYYDYHLNGIARLDDGTLVIAAEAGNAYRSTDEGASWEQIELPYAGSMFGILATDAGRLVAFGLRGHVLESLDAGQSWQEVETGSLNSLMGGTITDRGDVVLVGANGEVMIQPPDAPRFRSLQHPDGNDFADVVQLTGDTLLLVGEEGIETYVPRSGS